MGIMLRTHQNSWYNTIFYKLHLQIVTYNGSNGVGVGLGSRRVRYGADNDGLCTRLLRIFMGVTLFGVGASLRGEFGR
jgi:hypothetical protein